MPAHLDELSLRMTEFGKLGIISSPCLIKNEAMHMGFIMRKLPNDYGAWIYFSARINFSS